MNNDIRKAIYDKYIAPTKKERPDYIGVEIEMPVVNLNGQALLSTSTSLNLAGTLTEI